MLLETTQRGHSANAIFSHDSFLFLHSIQQGYNNITISNTSTISHPYMFCESKKTGRFFLSIFISFVRSTST
jgi:hypothetical protein